jgi:hypothetical protein
LIFFYIFIKKTSKNIFFFVEMEFLEMRWENAFAIVVSRGECVELGEVAELIALPVGLPRM